MLGITNMPIYEFQAFLEDKDYPKDHIPSIQDFALHLELL